MPDHDGTRGAHPEGTAGTGGAERLIRELLPLVQEAESDTLIGDTEGADFTTVEDWVAAMPAARERRQRMHAILTELGYPPCVGGDNTGESDGALVQEVARLRAALAQAAAAVETTPMPGDVRAELRRRMPAGC